MLLKNKKKLYKLRDKLVENVKDSPLFDTKLTVMYLEQGYLKIWNRYLEGKKPENIDLV